MRKGLIIATIIIVIGLLWYFFIKPQDYQIRVEAKTFPGTINQSLKAWNNSLNDASIVQLEDIKHLKQTVIFGDSTHIYTWNISVINDSTSQLKVDVKDPDHSLKNRLYIPFTDTNFEKGSRKFVTDFIKNLNQHRKEFKVTILEEEELPSTYCACVKHKTSQAKKAIGMKDSYPFLNSVLVSNGLQLNGVPFIETTDWDMANDSIAFNFCYPIIKTDSLPTIKDIIYKEFDGPKSLKAIYNGNYITSDRAWYALLDYAAKNNIKVDAKPIEFFFNNPNMGGDALLWKTEVFMPISESNE
ncbi:AraC family transcriptional regulator [uncultured Maribacter sp.]|uniref:AraC family transcriptional regulator n=1 Tax=uncultured Maribacter sp. TaxID=431308 RepID=UPI0030EC5545|tara:strand:- start:153848 stop:154747 length:900 start_codon:yes stop_codon:yes gene_type:complete